MKNTVKNKFWKVLVLDILFIIIFIGLFLFVRKNLITYVGSLQVLQEQLENVVNANVQEASVLAQSLEKSANKAYIYTFILTPILFFLIYTGLQGLSWMAVKKRSKKYILKFSLISIPFYVFLILFLLDLNKIIYAVLLFIFGYFAFVFYINPEINFVLKSFKRIYLFFPFYILYLILFFTFLFSGFLAFISFFIGNYSVMIPFALVVTLIFSSYKLILIEKFG